ncbi:MAG: hypothetical protein ACR2O6_03940 [Ilumatobacteraceae bacterium]
MERWTTPRQAAKATALMAAIVLAAGCGPEDRPGADQPSALLGGGIDDELDAMAILDPAVYEKIGSCFESAQFKVYVGDPEWQRIFEEVGGTPAGLRGICEDLAINDPGALDAIHVEWVNWENATGASTAASTAPPPPPPPPSAAPVTTPPPPSALPVTTPPPVTWSPDGCHPSYTPCVPIARDVDCKGSGNGPVYVEGPIQVIGYDDYTLADGDGFGCESS